MNLKITYKVGRENGVKFTANVATIAEAYRCVETIVNANSIYFPDVDSALSNYMGILVDIEREKVLKYDNHIFEIERE